MADLTVNPDFSMMHCQSHMDKYIAVAKSGWYAVHCAFFHLPECLVYTFLKLNLTTNFCSKILAKSLLLVIHVLSVLAAFTTKSAICMSILKV